MLNNQDIKTLPKTHGIFGWASFGGLRLQESTLADMEKGLNTSLKVSHQYSNNACGGSSGSVARVGESGFALIIGRPYWRTSTLKAIACQQGDAEALAHAYMEDGLACEKSLGSDFSFAIIDPSRKRALLCSDRLGHFPLYFTQNNGCLVFGTSASAVLAHPMIERELDPQGIYNYVYFHMVPSPGSIYKQLHKLQGGHLVQFDGDTLDVKRYWLPNFQENSPDNVKQQKNELRHILTRSVERVVADSGSIGAFLSGGLDSSTVVGLLSEVSEKKAQAFSIGFSAEGYDEMAYARITAKHFGADLHEYYVTPEDVVAALPTIATSYDEPFGNSSALPAWFCANLAKQNGIDLLLAGDGGDELFAGNERYAKQKLFQMYGHIPGWLKQGVIEPTANRLEEKSKWAEKLNSYISQAKVPLPDRLQTYNFLHRHLPEEIFNRDYLEQIDTRQPLDIQRNIYNAPAEASSLNRMMFLDWQYTLADNDLRKVSHMCAVAGVEVAYPMLDGELIKFSCKVPGKEKLKGQKLRHFYKKSLQGWLPDETISKSKQGFGLPFGVWMQSHKPLQEMAYDNLVALKKRHYFNGEFLDHLIKLHREGHASYYGELIWILSVLELWLANAR